MNKIFDFEFSQKVVQSIGKNIHISDKKSKHVKIESVTKSLDVFDFEWS